MNDLKDEIKIAARKLATAANRTVNVMSEDVPMSTGWLAEVLVELNEGARRLNELLTPTPAKAGQ